LSLIIHFIRLPTFKTGESKHISKHVGQLAVLNMAELLKESNKHVSNRSINQASISQVCEIKM